MVLFPRNHNPILITRKTPDKSRFWNILQNGWLVFLKTIKVMKNEESPRNCYRPEETKGIRQLNAVWYSRLGLRKKEDVNGRTGESQIKSGF